MKTVRRHFLKWEHIEPALLAAFATYKGTLKSISAINKRDAAKEYEKA